MKSASLIGRHVEIATLNRLKSAPKADFLVIYGRRRVGKTFLIRQHFSRDIVFEMTGILEASLHQQLAYFHEALPQSRNRKKQAPPRSWKQAFSQLATYLLTLNKKKKHVIFFDELPWLASPKSGFLPALDHFWNTFLVRHPQFLLIVCGSAASWMISKLIHHKGGLHNRITARIRLEPFTLAETKAFLKARKIKLSHYEIITLTMAFGGIPHYLESITRGQSAAQAIESACFTTNGLLRDEFPKLYPALFDRPERHQEIVRVLAKHPRGLTRSDLTKAYASGGRLTQTLADLEAAGFISFTPPFAKKERDGLYRLTDEYSIFYLRWIEGHQLTNKNQFTAIQKTPSWRAWSGYALESLAQRHIAEVKDALGISSVQTHHSSWLHRPNKTWPDGAQIDLVIDREDNAINLIEVKFSNEPFTITKAYANQLRKRVGTFRGVTKTRKNLFLTFLTVQGLTDNTHSQEVTDQIISADSLFL